MKTLLFALPLKPGKLDAYRAFVKEATGPRKHEYADLLKRYGLKTVKVWYAKLAGKEYMMVLHDAEEDALERLKGWASSMHPFDRWFTEQLLNCYEVKDMEQGPELLQFIFGFGVDKNVSNR